MSATADHERLVDVVFPRPFPQAYTYRVPGQWRETVQPGTRVRAPLGRAVETGVVIGDAVSANVQAHVLRPIDGLVDPDIPIPADVVALTRWVAEYYMCSWGEALGPASSAPGGNAVLEFARKSIDWSKASAAPKVTPTQRRILDLFSRRATVSELQIRRLRIGAPTLRAALRGLSNSGMIETRWKPAAPAIPNEAAVTGVIPGREEEVPQEVHERLSATDRDPNGIPWNELAGGLRDGRRIIKELMRDGALNWEPIPWAAADDVKVHPEPGRGEFDPGQRDVDSQLASLIDSGEFSAALLWGPTGSGKTALYCEAIRRVWSVGRTALLLVPEISLAGPMLRRLRVTLGEPVGVWHSGLTQSQRYWMARRVALGRYRIVVGARSAVFAPLRNLGLIVVDEEHADAYKQSDPAPRYHARDVAVVRARLNHATCILGSATPSCESYHNAMTGKYRLLRLTQRISGRSMPLVRLVDLSHRRLTAEESWITPELRDATLNTIRSGRKVIVFLNRRGYATMVACKDCGHYDVCPDCGLTLTFHRADHSFRCHLCAFRAPARDRCAKCGGSDFLMRGVGTQKIEEQLSALDPDIRLARLDADIAAKRGAAEGILASFANGSVNLLLGTQMVAKGLDVPGVGLVGVIWADQQMAFPDFRAEERTFQLLTQVAGRAGRDATSGGVAEVVVQTFRPDHDLIELAAAQNAELFFARELPMRASLRYPPFARLVLLSFMADSPAPAYELAQSFATAWGAAKRRRRLGLLLGPSPGAVPRRAGRHVVHILLKCDSMKPVQGLIAGFRESQDAALRKDGVSMIADVDPVDFW